MSKKRKYPRCEICWANWRATYRARYVAQQAGVKPKTFVWRLICKVCRQEWQSEGPNRPIFKLGRKASFT